MSDSQKFEKAAQSFIKGAIKATCDLMVPFEEAVLTDLGTKSRFAVFKDSTFEMIRALGNYEPRERADFIYSSEGNLPEDIRALYPFFRFIRETTERVKKEPSQNHSIEGIVYINLLQAYDYAKSRSFISIKEDNPKPLWTDRFHFDDIRQTAQIRRNKGKAIFKTKEDEAKYAAGYVRKKTNRNAPSNIFCTYGFGS